MTKSKLLKLLEKHNLTTVIIRFYDFKKMRLEQLKDIVNKTNTPFVQDKTFFVCKNYTLCDMITNLKSANSVNDYIYHGVKYTYRDIYDDLKHIIKHPIYIPYLVETSAIEYQNYYDMHKDKITQYHENNKRLFSMYAHYANKLDKSLFS